MFLRVFLSIAFFNFDIKSRSAKLKYNSYITNAMQEFFCGIKKCLRFLEDEQHQKSILHKTLVIGWLLGIGMCLYSCRDESQYKNTVFSRDTVTEFDTSEETTCAVSKK